MGGSWGLAIMNVVTGVFCQSAIEAAQSDRELATANLINSQDVMHDKLAELFKDIDIDESGFITMDEVERTLQKRHAQAYLRCLGIDTSDAWTFVKLLDADDSGTIDFEEFINGCMDLRGDAKAVHIATLAYDQR